MNYLELINNCLLELNYKQVESFTELVKNDHKKIMSILNIINQEICNTDNWNFLLRETTITIPANATSIENSIPGRILHIFIGNEKYNYKEDIEPFLKEEIQGNFYTEYNDRLLFPKIKNDTEARIIYYTKNSAITQDGTEKKEMTNQHDSSLIPMPFAQQLLTYGTCLRVKANPSYVKFSYWLSMYKEALANLRSKTCICAKDTPIVKLHRQ